MPGEAGGYIVFSRLRAILKKYRENELLKHQLKKYVGAVQKLRDGPQAYETLAQLEGPKMEEGSNKYIDYHYEASEYEKKLIQVLICSRDKDL